MGRGHLVKRRRLGPKIWLLVKFLKCSHMSFDRRINVGSENLQSLGVK